MRVAIDLTPLQRLASGCDRYLVELVRALAAIDDQTEYILFLNRGDRTRWGRPLPANFRAVALPFRSRAARLVFQQFVLPLCLRQLRVHVLHSPSFFTPLVPTRARHLLTVHDMTFFTRPQLHSRLRSSRAFRGGLRASIGRADLLAVPSRATAAELLRLLPGIPANSVRIVPYGVGSRFAPCTPDTVAPVLARLGIRQPYLLHVGTLEPRKNIESLLEAYHRLLADGRLDVDLVLAGQTGWGCEALLRRLQLPQFARRVHRLGYVADDDLPALYSAARLFVFPSADEGFGFPPLEAMACGTLTVASSVSALAENLSGAAVLVEPSSDAIHEAIARVLLDPPELQRLRTVGLARAGRFRWEDTARATRACYEELARQA